MLYYCLLSYILPYTDVYCHIILFLFRQLPCGQIREQEGKGFAALYFRLLADNGGYYAFFNQFPCGGNQIVSHNTHFVLASQ